MSKIEVTNRGYNNSEVIYLSRIRKFLSSEEGDYHHLPYKILTDLQIIKNKISHFGIELNPRITTIDSMIFVGINH